MGSRSQRVSCVENSFTRPKPYSAIWIDIDLLGTKKQYFGPRSENTYALGPRRLAVIFSRAPLPPQPSVFLFYTLTASPRHDLDFEKGIHIARYRVASHSN